MFRHAQTLVAIGASVMLAVAVGPALADKGGNGKGPNKDSSADTQIATSSDATASSSASAQGGAQKSGVISVPDAAYGGMTTATVNPGGANTYVFVQCYRDSDGKYVYAAYFAVDSSNHASVGPLWSTLWPSGSASCTAQEGYFRRDGFGKWVSLASTTFRVAG